MKIIDLFSGCGGFSLGFEQAGFETIFALEKDLWASNTYQYNHPNTKVHTLDITQVENPIDLLNKPHEVDGIIGGPPCQGFSLSGDRDPKDPRNSLFMEYIRFVRAYNPKFFVMENVTGILSAKTKEGMHVKDLIRLEAENSGYNISTFKLNAADYGVPQSRIRVFFIGIRSDFPYNLEKIVPKPSHFLGQHITISQALSDLPEIEVNQGDAPMSYEKSPQNDFQKWCRDQSTHVLNHVPMKHTARLVERFKNIGCGQSVANVSEEHMQRKRGDADSVSGKIFSQNNMRPFPDKPSPTVAASFQSNFIHPFFNRNYTAREGARLQSFPDHYIFQGKRTTMSWEKHLSQYQQIGNAVPPLLAKAIATSIKHYFENIDDITVTKIDPLQMHLFTT